MSNNTLYLLYCLLSGVLVVELLKSHGMFVVIVATLILCIVNTIIGRLGEAYHVWDD